MRLKDRRIAHKQVIDEVNVALFPHSGIDFFLHESIEMVSSYNRSNRLRMQNKVRKNNKYNSRTPKPFSKPATTHAMSPSDRSRAGWNGLVNGQKCLCGCDQRRKREFRQIVIG